MWTEILYPITHSPSLFDARPVLWSKYDSYIIESIMTFCCIQSQVKSSIILCPSQYIQQHSTDKNSFSTTFTEPFSHSRTFPGSSSYVYGPCNFANVKESKINQANSTVPEPVRSKSQISGYVKGTTTA